jgi:heme exporter protein D
MEETNLHIGFIVAAYLVTVVVLAGLVLWILADGRAQKKRLAALDARGIRRRSGAASK